MRNRERGGEEASISFSFSSKPPTVIMSSSLSPSPSASSLNRAQPSSALKSTSSLRITVKYLSIARDLGPRQEANLDGGRRRPLPFGPIPSFPEIISQVGSIIFIWQFLSHPSSDLISSLDPLKQIRSCFNLPDTTSFNPSSSNPTGPMEFSTVNFPTSIQRLSVFLEIHNGGLDDVLRKFVETAGVASDGVPVRR